MGKSNNLGGFRDIFTKNAAPGVMTAACILTMGADVGKYVALGFMFGKAVKLIKEKDISSIPNCVGWIQAVNFVTLDQSMMEIGSLAMTANAAAATAVPKKILGKALAASMAALVVNASVIGYAQIEDMKDVQKRCAQGEQIERYGIMCPKVNLEPPKQKAPQSP